jgi:hypothetical protein
MTEFACSICQYSSFYKVHVVKHINKIKKCGYGIAEIIEIPVDIICEYCNKAYSTKDNLNKHLKNFCKVKDSKIVEKMKKLELENKVLKKLVPVPVVNEQVSEDKLSAISITFTPEGFLYIIREREDIKLNKEIYKIGHTLRKFKDRYSDYPNGSQILYVENVSTDIAFKLEQKILDVFKTKFKLSRGKEYFEGDIKEMISLIKNLTIL